MQHRFGAVRGDGGSLGQRQSGMPASQDISAWLGHCCRRIDLGAHLVLYHQVRNLEVYHCERVPVYRLLSGLDSLKYTWNSPVAVPDNHIFEPGSFSHARPDEG